MLQKYLERSERVPVVEVLQRVSTARKLWVGRRVPRVSVTVFPSAGVRQSRAAQGSSESRRLLRGGRAHLFLSHTLNVSPAPPPLLAARI